MGGWQGSGEGRLAPDEAKRRRAGACRSEAEAGWRLSRRNAASAHLFSSPGLTAGLLSW